MSLSNGTMSLGNGKVSLGNGTKALVSGKVSLENRTMSLSNRTKGTRKITMENFALVCRLRVSTRTSEKARQLVVSATRLFIAERVNVLKNRGTKKLDMYKYAFFWSETAWYARIKF